MDPSKLKTMSKWPISTKKKEAQVFLGFANYYYRFIVNYSAKACPFIDWTKDVPFTWGHTQQQRFNGFEEDSFQLPSSPNLIEPLRQS